MCCLLTCCVTAGKTLSCLALIGESVCHGSHFAQFVSCITFQRTARLRSTACRSAFCRRSCTQKPATRFESLVDHLLSVLTFVLLASCVLQCKATLVVAPSHLVSQWAKEVQLHTGANGTELLRSLPCSCLWHCRPSPALCARVRRTLLITTKPMHQKVTYRDILQVNANAVLFRCCAVCPLTTLLAVCCLSGGLGGRLVPILCQQELLSEARRRRWFDSHLSSLVFSPACSRSRSGPLAVQLLG